MSHFTLGRFTILSIAVFQNITLNTEQYGYLRDHFFIVIECKVLFKHLVVFVNNALLLLLNYDYPFLKIAGKFTLYRLIMVIQKGALRAPPNYRYR